MELSNCNQGRCLRNKGFTLIELLAVIIILAVIALISVPIILNIIEKTRMSAFSDTAYGLIESAKLEYTEELMNGRVGEKTYVYPFEELKFSGSKPNGGIIRIDENGNVEVAIYNNRWCASNTKEDFKVTINNYEEGKCIIKDSAKDPVITLNGEKEMVLKKGDVYTELGVISKTVSGEALEYTVEITLDSIVVEQIDTNIAGIYLIVYSVSHNGQQVNITRTVHVLDENCGIKKTTKILMGKNITGCFMENDPEHNLRYVGKKPDNYVSFNNELWRIIGVFNGQAKIIREPLPTDYAWDKNLSNGGHGNRGYNDWSISTLQIQMNNEYLNNIESASKSYIDSTYVWKIGGLPLTETKEALRSECYYSERGNEV